MADHVSCWGVVVLETHTGEQIDEETVATLPELCMFLEGSSEEKTNDTNIVSRPHNTFCLFVVSSSCFSLLIPVWTADLVAV